MDSRIMCRAWRTAQRASTRARWGRFRTGAHHAAVAAALVALAWPATVQAAAYGVTALTPPSGWSPSYAYYYTYPYRISPSGLVTGAFVDYGYTRKQAFLYDSSTATMSALEIPPGARRVIGNDVNDSGQVVVGGFLWDSAGMQVLPDGLAEAINASGQIVGYYMPDSYTYRPALLSTSGVTELTDVVNALSPTMKAFASDINDNGLIVGYGQVSEYVEYDPPPDPPNPPGAYLTFDKAYVYDGSSVEFMDPLADGMDTRPVAINNQGEVAGNGVVKQVWETSPYGSQLIKTWHAFKRSSSGAMQDLGAVTATDINDSGHVVGYMSGDFPSTHAFLHDGTSMVDLNDKIGDSDWVLYEARGISNAGHIVGLGSQGAFLLTPTMYAGGGGGASSWSNAWTSTPGPGSPLWIEPPPPGQDFILDGPDADTVVQSLGVGSEDGGGGAGQASLVLQGGVVFGTLQGLTVQGDGILQGGDDAQLDGALTNLGTVAGPTNPGFNLILTGLVNGNGTFTGNVLMSGTQSPGLSPGKTTVENYTLVDISTLEMEIEGLLPGDDYDQFEVTGTMTFDGTLSVLFGAGYTPAAGQTFNLFITSGSGSLTGMFDTVTVTGLPAGGTYEFNDTTGVFTVSAVPEPMTAMVLIAGLAVSVIRRRR